MPVKRRRVSQGLGSSTARNASSLNHTRSTSIEALLDGGLPYSRKLRGHTACVNALAFSQSGRWLASGGDDPHIRLWDFHQDDLREPSQHFAGHRTNIFALAFSASSKFLYSGATDNSIHTYDLEYSRSLDSRAVSDPDTIHLLHKDSIRGLSCHPQHDEIFLSASDDGCIIMHDMRAQSTLTRAQGTLQHDTEFTSVQFHPEMPHIFVTSDNRGEVCLRDTRTAFGPRSQRRDKGVAQKYVTTISKPSTRYLSNPEVSSVTFDRTGTKLAATMTHFSPTIYSLSDPYPIAVCTASTQPDGSPIPQGERSYANSCTIKHGSFGGGGVLDDPYYCAGSDDFRTYIWKIPSPAILAQQREEYISDDWSSENSNTIGAWLFATLFSFRSLSYRFPGFAASSTDARRVPVTLSRPVTRLTGHSSIVNTALMHPTFPAVLTAGIERDILLHSPTPAAPFLPSTSLTLTPTAVRPLPPAEMAWSRRVMRMMIPQTLDEVEPEDDSTTIAMFDQIICEESDADVFAVRRWNGDAHGDEDTDDAMTGIDEA
ncbi:WD40 repeat-like protein [Fomitopsis serialis]|uniref:WD40 repeat-like protein n=1 Tax=Fomitopsis serialis TaxID=139415 RepID=UPI0020087611|nr:WD40 repeat-like protein [Neoantrodia serialis]KAH9936079.1 WD40 repeat-like protein [Neoantrodia serialis]